MTEYDERYVHNLNVNKQDIFGVMSIGYRYIRWFIFGSGLNAIYIFYDNIILTETEHKSFAKYLDDI